MNEPQILIVGQSHTGAIKEHLANHPDDSIRLCNFNAPDFKHTTDTGRVIGKGEFDVSIVTPFKPRLIISMIGGNAHNTLGLIENPKPFDVMDSATTLDEVDQERHFIPYSVMLSHFRSILQRSMLDWLKDIKNVASAPFYHVCSPPPNPDATFITKHPGSAFRDKVSAGIAPASLRRRLYDLHTRVVREFCEAHDIGFIPPPVEAVKDGFLAEPYWRKDPTHANAEYGRLVLRQIHSIKVPDVASV